MQFSKKMIPLYLLLLACIGLFIAAGFLPPSTVASEPEQTAPICCVSPQEHYHNSPWDFITEGFLHFYA